MSRVTTLGADLSETVWIKGVTPMAVREMTEEECREVLLRSSLGRLACSRDDQPYVVPIHFRYESDYIYVLTTLGQKIEWMRANPKACIEIDEIKDDSHWVSVVASGRYQELREPQYRGELEHARELLVGEPYRWWLNLLAVRRAKSNEVAPVFFRIQISSITGLRTVADHEQLRTAASVQSSHGTGEQSVNRARIDLLDAVSLDEFDSRCSAIVNSAGPVVLELLPPSANQLAQDLRINRFVLASVKSVTVTLMSAERSAHRYSFIANAEVAFSSNVRPARVELLSLAGAYLVMSDPFSKGASVVLRIRTKTEFFECKATVAHSTRGTGMGVMFNEMSPAYRMVLQEWIFKAADLLRQTSQPEDERHQMLRNQRRSHRSSFVVTAEVTDENSHMIIARLRNLNLNGCYIEMPKPLPEGGLLSVKVTAGKAVFQARGRVVYTDPNIGSGVEFQSVEPPYQAVLEEWLAEAQDVNRSHESQR